MNRPRPIHLVGRRYDPLALVVTVALGLAGALVARWIGTPLPWLLGAVVAVGTAAFAGLRIAGETVQFPVEARFLFVPIIGVAIGGSMTPALLQEIPRWLPSFLGLVLFTPIAHLIGFTIFRRLGGLSPPTAWFAAMPGGFIEAISMGEKEGADAGMLNLLQFLRLIVCIVTVPLAFMAIEGVAVGSASGVQMQGSDVPIRLWDVAVLVVAGALGLLLGRKVGLPAALITGPILASGAVHLAGLTEASPPGWMIALTQLVVGLTLGMRFSGLSRADVLLGLRLTLLSVPAALILAALFGLILHRIVGESVEAVVLAFAPGGVVEMSLIAVSLEVSVIYVAAHHVARILLAVFFGKMGYARLTRESP